MNSCVDDHLHASSEFRATQRRTRNERNPNALGEEFDGLQQRPAVLTRMPRQCPDDPCIAALFFRAPERCATPPCKGMPPQSNQSRRVEPAQSMVASADVCKFVKQHCFLLRRVECRYQSQRQHDLRTSHAAPHQWRDACIDHDDFRAVFDTEDLCKRCCSGLQFEACRLSCIEQSSKTCITTNHHGREDQTTGGPCDNEHSEQTSWRRCFARPSDGHGNFGGDWIRGFGGRERLN